MELVISITKDNYIADEYRFVSNVSRNCCVKCFPLTFLRRLRLLVPVRADIHFRLFSLGDICYADYGLGFLVPVGADIHLRLLVRAKNRPLRLFAQQGTGSRRARVGDTL